MSEQWEDVCRQHLKTKPALKYLAFTSLEGDLYGTNDKEFKVTSDLIKETKKVPAPPSILFMGNKYITLQKDDDCWIGKSSGKSLYVYPCKTMMVVGMTDSTDKADLCKQGNAEVSDICRQYVNQGY